MTKIQIIIDDGQSLKGFTCDNIGIQKLERGDDYYMCQDYSRTDTYMFTADHIVYDKSPTLISLPDELLLRIRDYNIDTDHQNAVEETLELKKKIESLRDQTYGWELRRDLAVKEWERYNKKIIKMIDEHPMAAAEVALEEGNLDAACYFAKKANKEENNKCKEQTL